ncbi:hypothetical protein J3E68DRAFT_396105 [Trichoderma sp. SZMC 28012]
MTQSETPPPQRQSHPTSSNLRHSSGMPWILQPDATKLPAPIARPIALQHSRAAYKAQPLSLPAPPHPFSSSLCPFFSPSCSFFTQIRRAVPHESPQTRESRCLASVLVHVPAQGTWRCLSPMTTSMYSYLYRHP